MKLRDLRNENFNKWSQQALKKHECWVCGKPISLLQRGKIHKGLCKKIYKHAYREEYKRRKG